MYPSRAYPVLINMKQVGVSLPLPLPLPGWNASLQKKWRSLNSPQKRTEEQPNSRKTEQWHREGKVEEGGLVEREECERKQRRGFLVRMSLKSCDRSYKYTGITYCLLEIHIFPSGPGPQCALGRK